jgi:hypothetical protein
MNTDYYLSLEPRKRKITDITRSIGRKLYEGLHDLYSLLRTFWVIKLRLKQEGVENARGKQKCITI